MKTATIEVLFGNYRRKILALLLLRPDEQFHVREIARLTGVPAGSLHRELRQLAEADLLLRTKSGNQVYYRANRNCPIFPELAGLFRKTAGLADLLREALSELGNKVEFAFIFGSVAKGEERSGSDVDLFLVGKVDFAEVVGALSEVHQRLGREVNPVTMRREEFDAKTASDPFIQRVLAEPKIFVRGDTNDLGESD